MGNEQSTRWKGHTKKTRVEECERITAREARHIGAPTLSQRIGNSAAERLWCLCPDCEKRALHLYQLPGGGAWKCRHCHRLTTQKRQEKGTRAAFEKALARHFARICQQHPATERMYQAIGEDYRANVAPFDWDKASPQRRAELLEDYESERMVRRVFEKKRMEYADRIEERNQATGAQIKAEFWQWWKTKHRSRARERHTAPTR